MCTTNKLLKPKDDGDYLGWRPSGNEPYKWLKYSQVNEYAEQMGSALIHFGFEPSKETIVGIYARNRPEWIITEVACNAYSFINVPLYDTLGADAIDFILKQSKLYWIIFLKAKNKFDFKLYLQAELRCVVCDDSIKALQLMKSKTYIEYIFVIDSISQEAQLKADDLDIKLLTLEQLKKIGKEHPHKPVVSIAINKTSKLIII